jgi:S-adenosylmethionine synthetase
MSVRIDTFGTGKIDDDKIALAVSKVFDLRPGMIIQALDLRRPIYAQIAAYGHFGRPELDLPWEKLNMVKKLMEKIE